MLVPDYLKTLKIYIFKDLSAQLVEIYKGLFSKVEFDYTRENDYMQSASNI